MTFELNDNQTSSCFEKACSLVLQLARWSFGVWRNYILNDEVSRIFPNPKLHNDNY